MRRVVFQRLHALHVGGKVTEAPVAEDPALCQVAIASDRVPDEDGLRSLWPVAHPAIGGRHRTLADEDGVQEILGAEAMLGMLQPVAGEAAIFLIDRRPVA